MMCCNPPAGGNRDIWLHFFEWLSLYNILTKTKFTYQNNPKKKKKNDNHFFQSQIWKNIT